LLDVLRFIVAHGGSNVPTERLSDCFWPAADGDASRENLEKTLQRLRRLLGHADVLPVRGGMATLNPDLCWVDIRAFEQLIARRDRDSISDALTLYRGPLFGPFPNRPWEQQAPIVSRGSRCRW
jgi:DNA-binding SARP family transcriptional activator